MRVTRRHWASLAQRSGDATDRTPAAGPRTRQWGLYPLIVGCCARAPARRGRSPTAIPASWVVVGYVRFMYFEPRRFRDVVEQAAREGWTRLAVTVQDRYAQWLVKYQDWPANRVVRLATLPRWPQDLAELRIIHGLTSLNLSINSIGNDGARAIAEHLTGLTSLNLSSNSIGDDGARAIAEHLTGLTSLNLSSNSIGDDGARAIAEHLTGLTSLELGFNTIGVDGTRAIAEHLAGLTSLNLAFNAIGDDGTRAIAEHLTGLTSLELGFNTIGVDGTRAIAEHLTGLKSLDLGFNTIGNDGARTIAEHLTGLRSLNLNSNSIGADGARAIAEHLAGLTSLDLGFNSIGVDGAYAIAEHLTGLSWLNLNNNSIGNDGARTIAEYLTGLTSINLWSNSIGDDGARAIAEHLTGVTSLDLGNNLIGVDGARAIAEHLTGLTSLELSSNSIGDDGARAIAEYLAGVTSLDLGNNSIGVDGARAIAEHLTGLTSLNLSSNSIGVDGARAIAKHLAGLTSLELSNSSIGVGGARAIAEHLTGLTSLELGSNSIGDDGARAIAEHLTGLTSLHLSRNKIGQVGLRYLLDQLVERVDSALIARLDLSGNDPEGLPIVSELLDGSDAQALLSSWRRVRGFQASELEPLNEAKVLVLGDEAVGKTSLVNFLVKGQPRNPSHIKTRATAIHERIKTEKWDTGSDGLRLNIWDFGGQEIMHGTHQFFLTARSVYLLVLEARREDQENIHGRVRWWLQTIQSRGGDSPIIVVINKHMDEPRQDLAIDEDSLLIDFPSIAGFVRTSCDDDDRSKESIASLRELIVRTTAGLPHVREPLVPAWKRVKEELATLAGNRKVLDRGDFTRLCMEAADENDRVVDGPEQRALLQLLDDLGVVVAHGEHKPSRASAREVHLLDPNWLTGAIYLILNDDGVRERNGVLDRAHLPDILDTSLYAKQWYEFILDMMKSAELELCYQMAGGGSQAGERYLIAEALPASRQYTGDWGEDVLRLRYTYDHLPAGLIPRLIVRAHRRLTEPQVMWRFGVLLAADGCEALVEATPGKSVIDIRVRGPEAKRIDAMRLVRDDLQSVHEIQGDIGARARIPLPDNPSVSVSYEYLIGLVEDYGSDHMFRPEDTRASYRVGDLLGLVPGDRRFVAKAWDVPKGDPVPSTTNMRSAVIVAGVLLVMFVVIVATVLVVFTNVGFWMGFAVASVAIAVFLVIAVILLSVLGLVSKDQLVAFLTRAQKQNYRLMRAGPPRLPPDKSGDGPTTPST